MEELVQTDRASALKMLGKRESTDWFLLNVRPYVRYLVNVSVSLHSNPLMEVVVLPC